VLLLNVHFHTLVLDGVYLSDGHGEVRFHRLPPPEDAEVERVTAGIARRVVQLLERVGLGPKDPDEGEPLRRNQPLLAEQSNGKVGGPNGAAAKLGMKRTTLQARMRKLGIDGKS
jgi:transcriptional regulator of acetoin/glycerol metabolism